MGEMALDHMPRNKGQSTCQEGGHQRLHPMISFLISLMGSGCSIQWGVEMCEHA